MTSQVARRPVRRAASGRRVRSALGHPFGLGLVLGVGLFVALWALGGLSNGARTTTATAPGAPSSADPRVEPTARALPPPARPLPGQPPASAVPRDDPGEPRPALSPAVEDIGFLKLRKLKFPVPATDPRRIRDDFGDPRTGHAHEALDILAPRGAPIVAVDDGVVQKLFTSVRGGLTVYQFDPEGAYCYYYAHLDRYASGLREGQPLRKGDVIGYVGTTGNAPPQTPHLHFAIFKLGPEKQWWKGAALNPFPLWGGRTG